MKQKSIDPFIEAARQGRPPLAPDAPEQAPFGFASRVAARAFTGRPARGLDVIERAGWCGAGISAAICVLAFAFHLRMPEPNPFDVMLKEDDRAAQSP
jgi:hypothetical protein